MNNWAVSTKVSWYSWTFPNVSFCANFETKVLYCSSVRVAFLLSPRGGVVGVRKRRFFFHTQLAFKGCCVTFQSSSGVNENGKMSYQDSPRSYLAANTGARHRKQSSSSGSSPVGSTRSVVFGEQDPLLPVKNASQRYNHRPSIKNTQQKPSSYANQSKPINRISAE